MAQIVTYRDTVEGIPLTIFLDIEIEINGNEVIFRRNGEERLFRFTSEHHNFKNRLNYCKNLCSYQMNYGRYRSNDIHILSDLGGKLRRIGASGYKGETCLISLSDLFKLLDKRWNLFTVERINVDNLNIDKIIATVCSYLVLMIRT